MSGSQVPFLRQLGQGMIMYANDNKNKLPPDLSAVVKTEDVSKEALHSPFSDRPGDADYKYLMAGMANAIPADIVVAYDAVELDIPNTALIAPAAPSLLTAAAASASRINLVWKDNSTNEINFLVERSLDNVTFSLIAAVTAGVTNYADIGLSPGATYYYRVRASNSGGNSAYTSVASATTFKPRFTGINVYSGDLVLRGSNGPPGTTYYVLSSTNAATPWGQWSRLQTNQFDSNGNFNVTNAPNTAQKFYLLQLP